MNRNGNGRPNGLWEVLVSVAKQRLTELRLRERDGTFRTTDPDGVVRAYGAMSAREFEVVNAPQDWQNRKLIPLAVRGLPMSRPWTVVDLGCGSGGSTSILASLAPPGSTVLGYDVCGDLLERAEKRRYADARGGQLRPEFVCQPITEPLCDPSGTPLNDESVDVAHAAGVVGHHMAREDVVALACEVQRVLRPDGVAVLDAGPKMPAPRLAKIMRARGLREVARNRVLPWGTRCAVTFRKAAVTA